MFFENRFNQKIEKKFKFSHFERKRGNKKKFLCDSETSLALVNDGEGGTSKRIPTSVAIGENIPCHPSYQFTIRMAF